MQSLLSGLITSKMRIRIIMRLFMNPLQKTYLRELADEFGASPSHIKTELDQLQTADLLKSRKEGRQILFSANQQHPIFNELHSMVQKALGMDKILESMITRLGNLEKAILIDDYAEGKDSGIIDLLLIGDINRENLTDLTAKTEKYIERKIRTLVLSDKEYLALSDKWSNRPTLILWEAQNNNE